MQGANIERVRSEPIILPGDEIGVIEEFSSGDGAFEDDGIIRSYALGDLKLDLQKKVAEVSPRTRKPAFPREGSEVLAEVGEVKRPTATLDMFRIDNQLTGASFTGVLHFSSMTREYARHMSLAVREGDLVKARVINTRNWITQVSINEPKYGVVYALCSKCGELLELRRTRLVCPSCGRVERRKVSESYGIEALS